MRGVFVTFEGVDGSGKSTQCVLLVDALKRLGKACRLFREPGGVRVAEAIRGILLAPHAGLHARTELLLFLAARAQLAEECIAPALGRGEIVLCDRFTDSTLAYQGYGRQADVEAVRRLNSYATAGLRPDATFLLDIPPPVGLARQGVRNRMEDEPLEFHERVRAGYLAEARLDPQRIRVVDATQSPDAVHKIIVTAVLDLLVGASARATGLRGEV